MLLRAHPTSVLALCLWGGRAVRSGVKRSLMAETRRRQFTFWRPPVTGPVNSADSDGKTHRSPRAPAPQPCCTIPYREYRGNDCVGAGHDIGHDVNAPAQPVNTATCTESRQVGRHNAIPSSPHDTSPDQDYEWVSAHQ
ncbi:hypothetical protein BJV74DRAFT_793532 [Russula compacta]|nr:hypothetical protein BJV74DRAFT_793532 [Russula compacta]